MLRLRGQSSPLAKKLHGDSHFASYTDQMDDLVPARGTVVATIATLETFTDALMVAQAPRSSMGDILHATHTLRETARALSANADEIESTLSINSGDGS